MKNWLLVALLLMVPQASAIGVSDSVSDSGFLDCLGVNDGGGKSWGGAGAGISASGTAANVITHYYSSSTQPNTVETIIRSAGDTPRIYDTIAEARKSSYQGGTGFQNAFAVQVRSTKTPVRQTGNYCDTYNRASSGPTSSWKTYGLSVGVEGQSASIGSGVETRATSYSGSDVKAYPYCRQETGGFIDDRDFAVCYLFTNDTTTENISFGPNPISIAYTGANGISSSYGEKEWTGKDNTLQKPLHPITVVKDKSTGEIVYAGASSCGKIAYYKDYAGGGGRTGSTSTSQATNSNTGFYRGFKEGCAPQNIVTACNALNGQSTNSQPTTGNPPFIGARDVRVTECPTDLQDGFGGCTTGNGSNFMPTQENLGVTQGWIDSLGADAQATTYEPIEGNPPAFDWPSTDDGSAFDLLMDWARGVYVAYKPSTCGGPSPGGTPTICKVTSTVQGNNRITWSAVDKDDKPFPLTGFAFDWTGSDEKSGNTNPVPWTYTEPGSKYATVQILKGGNVVAICSNTESLERPLEVACVGTPREAYIGSDPLEAAILWTAYPKGGSGTYTGYEWSGDLGGVTPDPSLSYVNVTYNTLGEKKMKVIVTDGFGARATSTECKVNIKKFTGHCFASPNPAKKNKTVTWTAVPSDPALTYAYEWTGDVGTPQPNTTSNPITTSYSASGIKKASVKVTSQGVTETFECEVLIGPVCEVSTSPMPLALSGSSTNTVTFGSFANPITQATGKCGDAATPATTSLSCSGTEGSCSFTCSNYTANGTIEATLSNSNGETVTCTAPVTVQGGGVGNKPPECNFTKPTAPPGQVPTFKVGENITFAATAKDKEDDAASKPITKGDLNFGDGSALVQNWGLADMTHPYTKTGTYTAKLKVKDTLQAEGTCTVTIKVISEGKPPTPTCKFTPTSRTVNKGNPAIFTLNIIDMPPNQIIDSTSVTCTNANPTTGQISNGTCTALDRGCTVTCKDYQRSGRVSALITRPNQPDIICNATVTVPSSPPPTDGQCPTCGGNFPDNYVSVDIATAGNREAYPQSAEVMIVLDVNVTKKHKDVTDVTLYVTHSTLDGTTRELSLDNTGTKRLRVDLSSKKVNESVKLVLPSFASNTLEKGVHTYTAVLHPTTVTFPPGLDMPPEGTTSDNADNYPIRIKELKAAVPETNPVLAVLIALIVITIISRNKRS